MFFVYMLQSHQDGLIGEVETYCRERVVAVMKIIAPEAGIAK